MSSPEDVDLMHLPQIASVVRPLHGVAYLATLAVAFLLPLGTRVRLLTLVPVVGGLLALRCLRGEGRDRSDAGVDRRRDARG